MMRMQIHDRENRGQIHPFTRAVFAPWLDHARLPISPLPRMIGRGTKPCRVSNDCLAAADRHASVPRSVSIHVRELDLSAPIPDPGSVSSGQDRPVCGTTHARAGLAAEPGGGPFSRTPGMGLCVVFPCRAPVPPRRIATRGSRGQDRKIVARVSAAGKSQGKALRRLNIPREIAGSSRSLAQSPAVVGEGGPST